MNFSQLGLSRKLELLLLGWTMLGRYLGVFLLWMLLSCSSQSAQGADRASPELDAVMKLLRQGQVEAGEQQLRAHLEKHADDVEGRVLLGKILDFDGRPDEAIKVWEAGLTKQATDIPLLLAMGEIQTRQSRDGPTLTYRRGTVEAKPDRDKAGSEKFKQEKSAAAIKTYEQILVLVPDHDEAALELAQLQTRAKNYDAALKLWRRQHELHPDKAALTFGLAETLLAAGKPDEALPLLQQAIKQDPHLAEAHEALAKLYEAQGKPAEAKAAREQGEFYASLPAFATLEYSDENRTALSKFSSPEAIQQWIADPSDRATQLLAIFCWSHPHNDLETRAFAELEKRSAKNLPLLRQLLLQSQSTCTIRSTARILAKQKDPGLFQFLVRRLPGDQRQYGFDMDIAGALAELGDARAVGPLVEVLNPQDKSKLAEDSPERFLNDRTGARARAAFALGKFDTEESKQALRAGLENEELQPFCNAALYRLTQDKQYVEALEKLFQSDERYTKFLVANFLRDMQTPAVQELIQAWDKQLKAELEKREKERQQDKE